MRVLILAVAGYDERLAHMLAEEIRRQAPEARFAGITTREHNLASRTSYMRSVALFESVTTQAQFLNQAAASGYRLRQRRPRLGSKPTTATRACGPS